VNPVVELPEVFNPDAAIGVPNRNSSHRCGEADSAPLLAPTK
jgi:hypothetical protein